MEDLGQPSSYLTLEEGADVYSCDGTKLGRVAHVLADEATDIFDGLVIDRSVLPGGNRFVDADQIEEIFERGVLLKIDAKATESLPVPSENPATLRADPTEGGEGPLEEKLRRAWDLISGKRFR
jgi:uncharacterized protein YrrD